MMHIYILGFIIIANLIISLIVYLSDPQNRYNKYFFLFGFSSIVWVVANFLSDADKDYTRVWWWLRLTFVMPSVFVTLLVYFSLLFPRNDKIKELYRYLILAIALITNILLFTNLIIKDFQISSHGVKVIFGDFGILYVIQFFSFFLAAVVILIKKYLSEKGIYKKQLLYFILGLLSFVGCATITNLVIPFVFDYFEPSAYGPYFYIFFILFLAYSITRHRLFNVKIITAEVFSLIIIFITFINLFFYNSIQELISKLVIFIAVIIFSSLLIRSVFSEVSRREELEILNKKLNNLARQLKAANIQLRKASQVIKEKNKYLEELLNMKTEFLRVVNHQLNTPLSIMKNAFAMVEEKAISPEKGFEYAKSGLERIGETISDFWEAYELEGTKMKMNKTKTDIEKIVNALIEEKKKLPAVNKRKLEIKVETPKFKIPEVYCDSQKIIHVISNLLDNAIFYTEKGGVTVSYEKSPKVLKVKITDTGIGLAPKNKEKLFQKFSRGQEAVNMKPDGSGLGLFIARKIIEGNDGQIGAESKGEGKGSTFYFTLPIYTKKFSQKL